MLSQLPGSMLFTFLSLPRPVRVLHRAEAGDPVIAPPSGCPLKPMMGLVLQRTIPRWLLMGRVVSMSLTGSPRALQMGVGRATTCIVLPAVPIQLIGVEFLLATMWLIFACNLMQTVIHDCCSRHSWIAKSRNGSTPLVTRAVIASRTGQSLQSPQAITL